MYFRNIHENSHDDHIEYKKKYDKLNLCFISIARFSSLISIKLIILLFHRGPNTQVGDRLAVFFDD